MTTPPRELLVRAQVEKFEAELDALMIDHRGEWIVYLDRPRHFAGSQEMALLWAFANLAHDAGFVVAEKSHRGECTF